MQQNVDLGYLHRSAPDVWSLSPSKSHNMAPDAADGATSSPEPSGDPQSIDITDMAESHVDHSQSDDKSPSVTKDTDSNTRKNAKDPSRPRRKKARRACYACQRAHLTCGS